uniref:Methyltransf_11 domain-containing protein n=1 Tax=Heterorhabditis bacteriophora TaxID=37862 RepID=A0A1I7WXG6_HETBA
MSAIEEEYVHSVYSRLATYQKKDHRSSSPRIWPNVKNFLESQPVGSIVIDIGCGEAKYAHPSTLVLGVDTCADVLISACGKVNMDLLLADAVGLPFTDSSADAVLSISVIHHLSTTQRRRKALAGRLPLVKFHKNSTKEQRVIEASIPIVIPQEQCVFMNNWFNALLMKVRYNNYNFDLILIPIKMKFQFNSARSILPFLTPPIKSAIPPPSAPKFLPLSPKISLLSGIKVWSPMLSRRLASLLVPVEQQLADELTDKILHEAITETMATLREKHVKGIVAPRNVQNIGGMSWLLELEAEQIQTLR